MKLMTTAIAATALLATGAMAQDLDRPDLGRVDQPSPRAEALGAEASSEMGQDRIVRTERYATEQAEETYATRFRQVETFEADGPQFDGQQYP